MAKAGKKPANKKPAGKGKYGQVSPEEKNRFNMKVVTVDKCIVCKQQCARGLAYIDKMAQPGAIGYGVPCILTKGKGYK
ncbi:hypothetical protein JQN58_10175 [Aneurinibacillus sp. BA2021]|nr:hypothetical protein [Aneurinibacillus sp. BA2021]